jgi:hemophore-related protein
LIIARSLLAAGALAAATAMAMPSAHAEPDPCSAANLTETISTVNHNISQYLQAHPDANQALGEVAKKSPFAAQSAFTSYFEAHPEEAADLHNLQQPFRDLSDQCGFQVTPGQVLIVMEDL